MLPKLLKCLRLRHPGKSAVGHFSPRALIAVILLLIPKSSRKLHAAKEGLCAVLNSPLVSSLSFPSLCEKP